MQEVSQKAALLRREQSLLYRRLNGRLKACLVAAKLNAEQTGHDRAYGIAPFAGAEIQHEPSMHSEALIGCRRSELIDQPGLADAGLSAHDNHLAMTSGAAYFDDTGKLRQLSTSPDE